MASPTSRASPGADDDCGEDQDELLSNSVSSLDASLNNLELQGAQKGDDALSAFRQQWQRELVVSPQRTLTKSVPQPQRDSDDEEEKAKQLFLRGVELERSGKLYEAVQHYKRAVQLLPDIERRLYRNNDTRSQTPEEAPIEEADVATDVSCSDNDDDDDEDEESLGDGDLVSRFQRILAKKGRLCEPNTPQREGHISWLPYEVVLLVLRWVVSSELDAVSLERTAAACRGLYLASRDHDLWRSLCASTWGLSCGTPKSHGFTSWREMYVERPRLRLNGCYISKTTYLRHGENSFQDQFYRPWYLVDYYRYLRFFAEGVVLMWTTAEEPAACVAHLRHRLVRSNHSILSGHYRLVGDKVIVVIKKQPSEKKPTQTSNTRFRWRRKETTHDQPGQTFRLELQLTSVRSRRNWQLSWRGYSVCSHGDMWTNFELHPTTYPPFLFSRVRHYTAEADAPLT